MPQTCEICQRCCRVSQQCADVGKAEGTELEMWNPDPAGSPLTMDDFRSGIGPHCCALPLELTTQVIHRVGV